MSARVLLGRVRVLAVDQQATIATVGQHKRVRRLQPQAQRFGGVLGKRDFAVVGFVGKHYAAELDNLRGVLQQNVEGRNGACGSNVKPLGIGFGKVLGAIVKHLCANADFAAKLGAKVDAFGQAVHKRGADVGTNDGQRHRRKPRTATDVHEGCPLRHKLRAQHAVDKVLYPHLSVVGDGGEVVLGVFLNEKLVVLLEASDVAVRKCNFCVLRKIILHNCSMTQTTPDVNASRGICTFFAPIKLVVLWHNLMDL